MFRIIDRYILRELLLPFAMALGVLTFMLVIPVVLKQGEELIAKGVEWSIIVSALLKLLPQALSLSIPMALLLAILIGFARLSADREFVALQACGVSLLRLLRPLGFVAALATAASAYETIVALPNANQAWREITYNVVASRIERSVISGVFFEDFPNLVIYVRQVPPEGGWRDVFVADSRHIGTSGQTTVYFAREGWIHLDREKKLVQLELVGGTAHTTFANDPAKYQDSVNERHLISLDPKTVFPDPNSLGKGAPEMTFAELRQAIDAAQQAGDPAYAYRIFWQQKWALPLTCPILALIGLALGATNTKGGKLASFVLGFGVIFVYYVLLWAFQSLAKTGRFSPEWAPWIPNLLMGTLAVALIAWRARSADQPIRLSLPAFWRRRHAVTAAAGSVPRWSRVVLSIRVPNFHLPTPSLLDRYVAREYWRIVLVTIAALLGLFYISTFIDLADEVLSGQTTTGILLRYFVFHTPFFLSLILPMSVLVATLVTVGTMTKNSELIVIRACGVSLYRTAAPLVLFAVMVGASMFALQEWVLPTTNREADRVNRIARGKPPLTSPLAQRWIVGRNGAFYHYDLFDNAANKFVHLWMYDLSDSRWALRRMTYVADASLAADRGGESLSDWQGTNGWVREFASKPARNIAATTVKFETFPERPLQLEPPTFFSNRVVETEQMTYDQLLTYGELRNYIEQLRASGSDAAPFVVALRRKVAFPFVTIIMTLIAVPFATSTGRRGALYGIGIGLTLAIAYWVTTSVFGALGKTGVLTPELAAWAPNILFGGGALYMVLTVRT